MDNTKTKATMDTRHETKTVNIGHNTTQKTKKISNTDPTSLSTWYRIFRISVSSLILTILKKKCPTYVITLECKI